VDEQYNTTNNHIPGLSTGVMQNNKGNTEDMNKEERNLEEYVTLGKTFYLKCILVADKWQKQKSLMTERMNGTTQDKGLKGEYNLHWHSPAINWYYQYLRHMYT
jgi:hypothetical protein